MMGRKIHFNFHRLDDHMQRYWRLYPVDAPSIENDNHTHAYIDLRTH